MGAHDIPDFRDDETVIRPRGDGLIVRSNYCPEHTELASGIAELRAMARIQEALLNRIDEKQDEQSVMVAELRADMAYHSKFWGAIAGAAVTAFWWLVGGK